MVGSWSRLIHSQIGASEPREIRPGLGWSGSPSIKKGSSGAKKYLVELPVRLVGWPALRNSARKASSTAAAPGISSSAGIASVATAGYTGGVVNGPVIGFIARGVGLTLAMSVIGLAGALIALLGPRIDSRA